jgi:hypothetical protein
MPWQRAWICGPKDLAEALGFENVKDFEGVVTLFQPSYRPSRNEVLFYYKGKPHVFEVEPDVKAALDGLDAQVLGPWLKWLSIPTKTLRAGATLTPEFASRNVIRDQWVAAIQSETGYIPFVDAMRGLFHMVRRDELWQKFNMSGGPHASLVSMDRRYLHKNFEDMMTSKDAKYLIKHPLEALQMMSEFTEEMTRVGEFARAIKMYGDDFAGLTKGGRAARDVSVNFSRIGAKTKGINALVAFWNARVQGYDKMARAMKENPTRTMGKALLYNTLPSLALWYAQKDDPYYRDEVPAWEKALFYNIITHHPDGSVKNHWRIPKGFEWGVMFGSVPEAICEWLYNEDPTFIEDMAEQVLEISNIFEWPTAAIPLIEWSQGRSLFFDRPIVPKELEGVDPVLQYTPYTTATVRKIAEGMSELPFLEDYASPAKIENFIRGYTAGLGKHALDIADMTLDRLGLLDYPDPPQKTLADVPLVKAFVGRYPQAHTKSMDKFYDEYHKVEREWNSLKHRHGISGLASFGVQTPKHPEVAHYGKIADAIAMHRQLIKQIQYNRVMSPEEKRKAIEDLQISMVNLARMGLEKDPLPGSKSIPIGVGQ